MHPRAAANVLAEIATLLELRGEGSHKSRAYSGAARVIQAIETPDIVPLVRSGEVSALAGIGPATLSVLRDLAESGDSEYLDLLRETTPEGLVEMLRIPGLGPSRIHRIHRGLGVESIQDLEAAARDGRLAALPGFGDKTAAAIVRGVATLRESAGQLLHSIAEAEARRLSVAISALPGVECVSVAGSIRRCCEVVRDIDLVVGCRDGEDPSRVSSAIANLAGVREVIGSGGAALTLLFENGTRADVYCVRRRRFSLALWHATGSAAHVSAVESLAAGRGLALTEAPHGRDGQLLEVADEASLYAAVGLPFIVPELRENRGELEAGTTLPHLVELADIRGALHCHSNYSDGTSAVEAMARAAMARGWSYLGITDHSQSAFYAGGLTRDAILRQHDEIDRVNDTLGEFRVLKGIEADILADGEVDYGHDLLDRFDYVVASVHSRFGMNQGQMTERVLRALDDPHVTILGHPTGRLLLTREAYALDIEAMIDRAAARGVAIELNCDPHRLDLDWRWLRHARERGVVIEIGPDAHSPDGLENMTLGVGIARKGWLEAADVLNARSAAEVLAFARARREVGGGRNQLGERSLVG